MIARVDLFVKKMVQFINQHRKLVKGIKIAILVLLISMNLGLIYVLQNMLVVFASYMSITDSEGLLSLIFYGFVTSIISVWLFWFLVYKLVQIIARKR